MRTSAVIAVLICTASIIPFKVGGGNSLVAIQQDQRLTPQEAVAAARPNGKPGSSFTVLKEIEANVDTRRIGDEALKEAQAHHIALYKDGILADVLRSGGFVLAETEPQTANVIALHLVSLGPDGVPNDASYGTDGIVKLADAQQLAKDTTEFVEQLYSTPSEALSLESRFYGGRFPEYGRSDEVSIFAVPRSLLKIGADPIEVREAAALYGHLALWGFRYAVTMPTFAASPMTAIQAAGAKWEALKREFLSGSHMDPHFDFDLENIRSRVELQKRVEVLTRLDKFMEDTLNKESNPDLVKANISVATIPLGIVEDTEGDQTHYNSGTGSLLVIYWQRLPAGGFAVRAIGEAG
jgi:hypothetical protein